MNPLGRVSKTFFTEYVSKGGTPPPLFVEFFLVPKEFADCGVPKIFRLKRHFIYGFGGYSPGLCFSKRFLGSPRPPRLNFFYEFLVCSPAPLYQIFYICFVPKRGGGSNPCSKFLLQIYYFILKGFLAT